MTMCQFLQQCTIVHILIGYIFIVSGVILNFIQLCSCIVWPFSHTLYRRINRFLAYNIWSQLVFLGEWWSGSQCTLIFHDERDFQYVGKEHAITMMNHKYDVDWLMGWIISERLSMLSGTKIYGKSILKFVPIIGWSWVFTENIFLERNWDKDKRTIVRDVAKLREYPPGMYVWYLLFCEGTRFSEKKHKLSNEVARSKGLPELKHHLLPRTRGFALSVAGMKGTVQAVYNIEVGFLDNGVKPTLTNVLNGKALKAQLYMRRFPLDDIPSDEAECTKWVHELYREKDALFEHFTQKGSFPGHKLEVKRRRYDLICWCFWTMVTTIPLFYYIGALLLNGSLLVQLSLLIGLVLFSIGVRKLIAVTESEKGSDYGSGSDEKQKKSS